MTRSQELVQSCSGCGASIYPEHFQRGLAVRQSGKLLCKHCFEQASKPAAPPAAPDTLAIQLEDQPEAGADQTGRSSLHGYAGFSAVDSTDAIYKKPTHTNASVANRMRTFHSKLSEGAIFHLDQQVNSWLDAHPDVEIKFANTTVGTWEGKHPEPNLILTIFY